MEIHKSDDFRAFAKSYGVNSMTLHKYEKFLANNSLTPYIYEEREKRGSLMDVFSRLVMDRTIFLGTAVTDDVCSIIMAQMLYLNSIDSKKDIDLYIHSPGGSVVAGNTLLDCMDFISPDITTTNVGMAASMGAVILSHGKKGKRKALKRSRTMIHQISSGMQGKYSDMEIDLELTKSLRKELYETLAENTGKTFEQIEKDCYNDNWMTSQQALEYKIIDQIITKK
jgi:ATP-dependent Clp protease protease subunit